jgi:hypothetical protein
MRNQLIEEMAGKGFQRRTESVRALAVFARLAVLLGDDRGGDEWEDGVRCSPRKDGVGCHVYVCGFYFIGVATGELDVGDLRRKGSLNGLDMVDTIWLGMLSRSVRRRRDVLDVLSLVCALVFDRIVEMTRPFGRTR